MIHKTIVREIALAALTLLILVGASFAPTFAATKIFDSKVQNLPFGPFPTAMCGAGNSISGNLDSHVVIWDQDGSGTLTVGDKVDIYSNSRGEITNAAGDHEGTFGSVEHENRNDIGSFPITFQTNSKVTCKGDGSVSNIHFGFTVDNNGDVHTHS